MFCFPDRQLDMELSATPTIEASSRAVNPRSTMHKSIALRISGVGFFMAVTPDATPPYTKIKSKPKKNIVFFGLLRKTSVLLSQRRHKSHQQQETTMTKRKTYKSQAESRIVEVGPEVRALIDRVNKATDIPRRRIVEKALLEYLPQKYASELR
jgi:hypothetical protein